jgi:hypothetical protein
MRILPGTLEHLVIVAAILRVNVHAVAKLTGMFVKRTFEPALAQPATYGNTDADLATPGGG